MMFKTGGGRGGEGGNSYMQRLKNFRRLGYKSRILVSLTVLTTKHAIFRCQSIVKGALEEVLVKRNALKGGSVAEWLERRI